MTPLSVIITIAAYFAILFTVSYIAGRKADNAGFFVGNRKSSWYMCIRDRHNPCGIVSRGTATYLYRWRGLR